MTRVRMVGIAVTAAALLTATACSSSSPAETTNTAGQTTEAPDPGQLTVWVMGDSSTNFEELIAPFVADTGTKVDVVAVPWDSIDQKLTTAVASGDGPDLLQIGVSKLRNTADSGALLALDADVIADYPGLDPSNYVGDPITIGGSTMAVPWVSDTRVLFYRSDILAKNGIDGPPSTWDELRADAKVLSARGDDQYGYYIPQWDSALPMIMTWAFGGDAVNADGMVDFDTEAFRNAADLYTGLYSDGSVPTNGDFDQTQGFVSGIAPMLISGPYLAAAIASAAPELEGSWSIAPVPSADTNTSLLAGSSMGVWKSTDNQAGALALLEFLSLPQTQVAWYSLDGQLPSVAAAFDDATLASDPLVAVYSEQLSNSRALPLVPNWDGETGKALLDGLNSIVLTGADKDSALSGLYAATAGTSVN